jgi:hypothetical protein
MSMRIGSGSDAASQTLQKRPRFALSAARRGGPPSQRLPSAYIILATPREAANVLRYL